MLNNNRNYHSLFEQVTDAIMITDFNGNFTDVNSSLCTMFGYTKEELLRLNVKALLDAEHLADQPIRFDLLKKGDSLLNQRKMVHKNGTIIYVESNAKKITDNRILAIARDITQRKKVEEVLQKSEANLHTIFDNTDTIYVLLDNNLCVISYNPRAFELVQNELHHVIKTGEYFVDYFPVEKRADLAERMKGVLLGKQVSYEVNYPQPDGTSHWYYVRILPISKSGSNIYGLTIAVSDITEKKLLEREVLLLKVQEQKNIIRAVLKAQEIERNKIGQELHDNVNQILSGIKLYLDMIGKDEVVRKDLVNKANEFIDIAISEIRLLSKEQVTPLKAFDLKELVEELIRDINANTRLKTKFRGNITSDLILEEDLKLNIYRIVQEQVNNILKHAEALNAAVSIEKNNGTIQISLFDDGKGFDFFAKRKGIGISNIINRAESYNGEVLVDSNSGNGCRMEIRIPHS